MKAKELVSAVKNNLSGKGNEKGGNNDSVLSQKDVAKVIKARVDNIMKAIEDVAIKSANTTAANVAVQDIETSLTNFANSMEGTSFKGTWFKFFKFKRNVKQLVRYTNSLYEITKGAEPGIKAMSSLSFLAEGLSEICESIDNVTIPKKIDKKTMQMRTVISHLKIIIYDIERMSDTLKKTPTDFKNLKNIVIDIKTVFDSINEVKIPKRMDKKTHKIMTSINNIKVVIEDVNTMSDILKKSSTDFKNLKLIVTDIKTVFDSFGKVKVPMGMKRKTNRLIAAMSGLKTIVEAVEEMEGVLKKSKQEFRLLKAVVDTLKDVIDTLKSIHVGIFFQLRMKLLLGALNSVKSVINRVARMKKVGKALWKIRQIKMFFNNLALMFIAITLLIPIFVLAPVAMLVVALSMWVFRLIMKLIVRLVRKIAWDTVESTLYMVIIVLALVAMTVMLLIMASLAQQVVMNALWIIGLLAIIIVVMYMLKFVAKIASKLASAVAEGIVGLGSLLGLLGIIFIMMVMMNIMATASKNICVNAGYLLGAFGIMTAVIGLAIALSFLGYGAMFALAGMGLNLALISMLFLLVIQINAIQKFKLEYKAIHKNIKTTKRVVEEVMELFSDFSVGFFDGWSLTLSLMRVRRIVNQIEKIVKSLNFIQSFKLNKAAIKKNIKQTFDTVNEIESFINESEKINDDFSAKDLWANMKKEMAKNLQAKAAAGRLKRTEMILGKMMKIAETLNAIQDIKLNEKAIEGNTKYIFEVVDKIETFIGEQEKLPDDFSFSDLWSSWKKEYAKEQQAEAAEERLNRVTAILCKIQSIADTLNDIQKITFNESDITTKLGQLFRFVDFIEAYIKEQERLPDDFNIQDLINSIRGNLADNLQAKAAENRLAKSEVVLLKLKNMTDSLKTIQDIKIDPDKAKEKVKKLFQVSNDLMTMIVAGETMDSKEAELINNVMGVITTADFQALNKSTKELNQYAQTREMNMERTTEHLGRVESVLTVVTGLADKFSSILKINITPEKVKTKVSNMFTTADEIIKLMTENSYDEVNDEFEKKFSTILDIVTDLNDTMTDLAKVDGSQVNGQKKMLDNYGKFIDKVNTIDVEKVKTTADVFGQMAKFSESINGDFEELANTLNEKLMPVLEELKGVMSEIPEKLDKGFADTSASIGANQSSVQPNEVKAQVSRENPKMDEDEINKEVLKRIRENNQDKMNGTAAKLDELIGLLKGYTGQPVIVRTI